MTGGLYSPLPWSQLPVLDDAILELDDGQPTSTMIQRLIANDLLHAHAMPPCAQAGAAASCCQWHS